MRRILLAACLCAFAVPAFADPTADALAQAQKSYSADRLVEASKSAEKALAGMYGELAKRYAACLPAAPSGFTAKDDADARKGFATWYGMGQWVKRDYRAGKGRATATIAVDAPLFQGLLMYATNPMVAANAGYESATLAGQEGYLKYDEAKQSGDGFVIIANRIFLKVEGSGLTRAQFEELFNGFNAAKIKEIVGL